MESISHAFSAANTLASLSYTALAEALGLSADHGDLFGAAASVGAELQEVDNGGFQLASHPHDGGIKELTHLRDDAVGDAKGGKSAIDDAYEGSNKDLNVETDPSKEMQAARALATERNFSPAKREAFLQYIQDHKGDMKVGTIKNGLVIDMANGAKGGYHAQTFVTKLPEDQRDVLTGTFEYSESGVTKTETVYILNDCANPAVDAADDVIKENIVPPAEVIPEVKPVVTYQVDPSHVACGKLESLLLADIHVPNADPNSPEYKAAMHDALAQIEKAQKATDGKGFHDFTGVRVIGPDGHVLQVGCVEEGGHEITEWSTTDTSGKKTGAVNAENYTAVVTGTLDNKGDGYVTPIMDATFDGEKVNMSIPANPDTWASEQLDIIKGDVMSDGGITTEQYNALLNSTIPPEFFDMSYQERVSWLKNTYGISESAAKDFASYVGAYSGDLGKAHGVIHVPVTYEPKPGETFGTFLRNATKAHHADIAGVLK